MTKHLRGAMLVGACALAWSLSISTASADEWNRRTILTIDQSMVVPGATLTPGTYTFLLANPDTSRDVVSILRDDGSLVTSAPIKRMQRNSDKRDLAVAVVLSEKSSMPLMKGWFYPGLMSGFEFVYPKAEARTIARAEAVEIPVAQHG